MPDKIIITKLNRDNRTYLTSALLDDSKIIELYAEPLDRPSLIGNIYIGKVQNVVRNLNAAFIEIAPGEVCYYPFDKHMNPVIIRGNGTGKIVQGTELLVQVSKDPIKTKAASVTTNLTLTGRYSVLTLENKNIGVSAKLPKDLRTVYRQKLQNGPQMPYGVIVRTSAAKVDFELVLDEIRNLKEQMDMLLEHARTRMCFTCMYKQTDSYLRFIQNLAPSDLSEIITDDSDIAVSLQQLKDNYIDLRDIPVRLYDDPMLSLHKLYSYEYQIDDALKKQVWLKSGGYLVIEQTEALTVIDVNTGKSVNKHSTQEHFMKLNLEAAKEAAAQIRLRNLSGIILIDFIDLDSKDDREALISAMRDAVKPDPLATQVVDMTRLQLMELTRKKVQKSLKEQLT